MRLRRAVSSDAFSALRTSAHAAAWGRRPAPRARAPPWGQGLGAGVLPVEPGDALRRRRARLRRPVSARPRSGPGPRPGSGAAMPAATIRALRAARRGPPVPSAMAASCASRTRRSAPTPPAPGPRAGVPRPRARAPVATPTPTPCLFAPRAPPRVGPRAACPGLAPRAPRATPSPALSRPPGPAHGRPHPWAPPAAAPRTLRAIRRPAPAVMHVPGAAPRARRVARVPALRSAFASPRDGAAGQPWGAYPRGRGPCSRHESAEHP